MHAVAFVDGYHHHPGSRIDHCEAAVEHDAEIVTLKTSRWKLAKTN